MRPSEVNLLSLSKKLASAAEGILARSENALTNLTVVLSEYRIAEELLELEIGQELNNLEKDLLKEREYTKLNK